MGLFVQLLGKVGQVLFWFRPGDPSERAICEPRAIRLFRVGAALGIRLVREERHHLVRRAALVDDPGCLPLPDAVQRAMRKTRREALLLEPHAERLGFVGQAVAMGHENDAVPGKPVQLGGKVGKDRVFLRPRRSYSGDS